MEGKKQFCENCGEVLEKDEKFCPNCGKKIDSQRNEDKEALNQRENIMDKIKGLCRKQKQGFLIIVLVIGASVVLVTGVVSSSVTHNKDLKMATAAGITLEKAQKKVDDLESKQKSLKDDISNQNEQLSEVKKQVESEKKQLPTYEKVTGGTLSAGVYTVGSDLKAGVYDFKYTATASQADYWSSDYLYITNANSEGTNETLGGTKYDLRFGGWSYEKASKGATGHTILKNGDVLNVESDFGNWTY